MHVFSKEFHISVVKPGGESGFPRFRRECVKRISLEGIERKRLALGFFCQSLFFFTVTHTSGSRWSPKEFHILVVKPRGESGFPRFLRECVKRISLEGIERKRLALGFFCQSHLFPPDAHAWLKVVFKRVSHLYWHTRQGKWAP